MPELPEIEVLSRKLDSELRGDSFKSVKFYRSDLREPLACDLITKCLTGSEIKRLHRRSKYLILETSEHSTLIHLGMSGQFLLEASQKVPFKKHTHIELTLNSGRCLRFVDPRRFGRFDTCALPDFESHRYIAHLGPEPLESNNLGLLLFNASRRIKQPIKNFIMDPSRIVGVGNIYASESLFLAGISPLRAAGTLKKQDFQRLSDCIQQVLQKAIDFGGTSIRDYRHPDGSKGSFAFQLFVYGRKGQNCTQCQRNITEKKLAGRSSFFCSYCQK